MKPHTDPHDDPWQAYDPSAAFIVVGIFAILTICIVFLVFYHFFQGDL